MSVTDLEKNLSSLQMKEKEIEEECDDDEKENDVTGGETAAKKKNKKKKKKTLAIHSHPAQDNSIFRRLGSWSAVNSAQTLSDPTVPIAKLYSPEAFPIGQILEYPQEFNALRMTSEEKRHLERLATVDYNNIRQAGECHRQVRKYVQSFLRPGITTTELCQRLEAKSNLLIDQSTTLRGKAFPTGCSLNHVAAHYSPNAGDNLVITQKDICKLDFGVHVNGLLVDSAFTVAFDEKFDPLIAATQEGTNVGIKEMGIDARIEDISVAIQEAIESFEMVDERGKTLPIKPIRNLNGHSIERNRIHGKKVVPIAGKERRGERGERPERGEDRMEEGEVYAIETFASTGKGLVWDDGECSHYMVNYEHPSFTGEFAHEKKGLRKDARDLMGEIEKNFGSLAFCRRWLDELGYPRHLMPLKQLVDADLVHAYPPLVDVKGCYTSQMEHTIILRPTCKEVVTRGEDY